MGMTKWNLYKILDGINALGYDRIPALVNASGDIDIMRWHINRCHGIDIIETGIHELNGDIRDEIESLIIQVGKVSELRRIAYADGRLDANEKARLLKSASGLLTTVETMIEEIKSAEVT